MKTRKLFWQLFNVYFWIPVLILLLISIYACLTFRSFYYELCSSNLTSNAKILSMQIESLLNNKNYKEINNLTQALNKKTSIRFTVILPNGKVVADSLNKSQIMDNHADRPEIKKAIATGKGSSIRYSYTMEEDFLYTALPIESKDKLLGVTRVSVSIRSIKATLKNIYLQIAIGVLALITLIGIISYWFSKKISTPLNEMKIQAEHIANGDYNRRINLSNFSSLEIENLGLSINNLAKTLNEKIKAFVRQENEQEAVFSSMIEGILAISKDYTIIKINKALSGLLDINLNEIIGKKVYEVIRITTVQDFVNQVMESPIPIESEILNEINNKIFQINGTPLINPNGDNIGCLIVFNDITMIRKLESHRKEFVANVSHELRTPITSIKGFIETLRDGAINDKEAAKNFLEILFRQTNRLNSIIEDLLKLSTLEREKEKIFLEDQNIYDMLKLVTLSCESKAKEKNIQITLTCDKSLTAKVDSVLLEQAIINLLDNSIKYSKSDSNVLITAQHNKSKIEISVSDTGIGIAKEHLSRIFERFYRVDKARSRNLGGTGLGLSIVKHIAEAHKGEILVESELGKGSKFLLSV